MVKTLRRKFIAITMISVSAVFLIILGVINIVNYTNVYNNAKVRLDVLEENNGKFPERDNQNMGQNRGGMQPGQGGEFIPGGKPNGTFNGTGNEKVNKKKSDWLGLADNVINEETPFESRYFSVTLSQDGAYISSNLDNIVSVKEEDAISYATTLYSKGSTDGMYEDFAYRSTTVDGNIMYIFLDCKRDLSSFRSFLLISILVTVVGLTLVFLLSYILSRIVLKPVFESYEKQKRFITDASHELKTPVAIIKANTEVIEMENGESEWTHSITKQANRLTSLTEKMVLLSRMDEGDFNKDFVNVNISDLFGEICESYEPIAVKMNKKYAVNIEEGIVIKGDEGNLTQMMSLLMDNAFKYSDEEGNINVSLAMSGRNKVLKVRNTVDNISEGSHDELFERFYRRDKSRNSKTGGSGIGLSVVQAIAESHKGTITAKSYDMHSIEFKIVF